LAEKKSKDVSKKKIGAAKSKNSIVPSKKSAAKSDNKKTSKKDLSLIEELSRELDAAVADRDEPVDPQALARGDKPMTIIEHLDELRSRFIKILIAFVLLFFTAFYFSDPLIAFINAPFEKTGNMLNIFTLAGGIMVRIKISFALTILILVPLIIYHLWRFIVPAIEKPDRTFSRATIFSAIIMFYIGAGFIFLTLPLLIKLLLSFIDTSMNSTIGADDYLRFIFFMALLMGFLFELPIVMLILTKIGLLTPHFLIKNRKYAFIIILIVSAAVTSGSDIFALPLIGVPLMLLYEITIVVSKIMIIRKKRKELMLM
jgi:sec-independent protein translocase protein TatC